MCRKQVQTIKLSRQEISKTYAWYFIHDIPGSVGLGERFPQSVQKFIPLSNWPKNTGTSSGGCCVCTPDHCQYDSSRDEVLWVNTAWKVDEHGVKFVLDRLARTRNVLRRMLRVYPRPLPIWKLSVRTRCVSRNRKSENKHINSRFVLFLYDNYIIHVYIEWAQAIRLPSNWSNYINLHS